jgi:hypothetical protein
MKRSGSRLTRVKRLLFVGVGFIVTLAVIGAVVGASAPPDQKPRCDADKPCGEPPSSPAALRSETHWAAKGLGVALDYDPGQWKVEVDQADTLQLTSKLAGLVLIVQVERTSNAPSAMVDERVSSLGKRVLGMEIDPDKATRILGPAVGHVDGAGRAYVGALDTPQGVQQQLKFALLASTQRGVGVKVTALTDEQEPARRKSVYQLADAVINSVTWS